MSNKSRQAVYEGASQPRRVQEHDPWEILKFQVVEDLTSCILGGKTRQKKALSMIIKFEVASSAVSPFKVANSFQHFSRLRV